MTDSLKERARALGLHGLVAHWGEIGEHDWAVSADRLGRGREAQPQSQATPRRRPAGAVQAAGRLRLGLAAAL